jgi:hypothetical protein
MLKMKLRQMKLSLLLYRRRLEMLPLMLQRSLPQIQSYLSPSQWRAKAHLSSGSARSPHEYHQHLNG